MGNERLDDNFSDEFRSEGAGVINDRSQPLDDVILAEARDLSPIEQPRGKKLELKLPDAVKDAFKRSAASSVTRPAYAAVQNFKEFAIQLIRTDPESTRLVKAALQERLEVDFIRSMDEASQERFLALRNQRNRVDQSLREGSIGKPTTLLQLYNSGSNPPIDTIEGLNHFLTAFLPELVANMEAAPQIGAELAEIKAYSAILPHKTGLEVMRLKSRGEILDAQLKIAPKQKELARARAETAMEYVKAPINIVGGTILGVPMEGLKQLFNNFGKWVDEHPGIAIPATTGGLGGSLYTAYYMVTATEGITYFLSSLQATGIGIAALGAGSLFGGIAGVGAWGLISKTFEKVDEWLSNYEWYNKLRGG